MTLKLNAKGACMDCIMSKRTDQNISPAFRVKELIRKLENEFSEEAMLVEVNDHHKSKWNFELPVSKLFDTSPIVQELSKHRLVIRPFYDGAVEEYLLAEYKRCNDSGKIVYRHHNLGWTDVNGQEVFLYDKTNAKGTTSCTDRTNFRFRSGDEQVYKDFLRNTVYPVPTLALAMSIGYSAVVISRLKNQVDLGTVIVNFCGASSTGKTTVEELLVSPFACPVESNGEGLIHTFHATQNATFAQLEGIHGLPIALDDTTSNNYLNLSNLVYTIASGEEKARCTQDGGIKAGNRSWSGLVVISSETPIQESDCENQGLKARVVQTQGITWTPDAATANLIKRTVRANYGFTGYEFAQFVEAIPVDKLYADYILSQEQVNALMPLRDNLSDRLESKYAAIHLTIELMNQCFALSLNANELLEILLKPEQTSVLDRDIAKKGENAIKEFLISKRQHFDRYTMNPHHAWILSVSASGDRFGFTREGKYCEVYMLPSKVDEVLKDAHINETATVKARWKERGLIKTDKDHYAIKKHGTRYINFIFNDGFVIGSDIGEPDEQTKQQRTTSQEPPVSDIAYDDSAEIDKIFGDTND